MSESDKTPNTGAESAIVPMDADDSATDNSVSSPPLESAKSRQSSLNKTNADKPYSKETKEVLATLSQVVEVNALNACKFASSFTSSYRFRIPFLT